jgi:hypothetical protein
MRPLIAVTGVPIVSGGVLGWRQGAVACTTAYVEAVVRGGGDPVIVPPVLLDDETASARLSRFDGLLLVGGGDIDPALYGQEPQPETAHISPARDEFEIPLLRAAIDCRRCASAGAPRSSTWPSAGRCISTSATGKTSSPTATPTAATASSMRSGCNPVPGS